MTFQVRVLTHCDDFPPIPRTPVVIEGVMTRSRPHYLRTESYWINMRPFSLNPFAVCPTHPTTEIQRPSTLTLFAMPEDMELGDDSGKEYITDFKLHSHGECGKTTCEVDALLTRDVIGDDEHGNGYTHQCGE